MKIVQRDIYVGSEGYYDGTDIDIPLDYWRIFNNVVKDPIHGGSFIPPPYMVKIEITKIKEREK